MLSLSNLLGPQRANYNQGKKRERSEDAGSPQPSKRRGSETITGSGLLSEQEVDPILLWCSHDLSSKGVLEELFRPGGETSVRELLQL